MTIPGAAAYLYGYLHRVRSSRRLERETQCNVEVMWLVRRLTPDYKTISDFRTAHAAAMPNVFRAFTVVCRQLELFGAELVGIDDQLRPSKPRPAATSPPEVRRHLRRIDARVKAYLAELDARDRTESAAAGAGAPAEPRGRSWPGSRSGRPSTRRCWPRWRRPSRR